MANAQFTCTLHAWREGNVLKAYMEYRRTDGASYYYQDQSLPAPTMDLGGVSYTDTNFQAAVHNGVYINPALTSQTFSRTVAGSGNRTVTWSCGSGYRSDFQGSWSVTIYFPPSVTPPSGGSISDVTTTTNSITATVSLTSWGTGGSVTNKELCVLQPPDQITTPGMPQYYTSIGVSALSSTLTVDNDSQKANNPQFTINPNTFYNIGIYANNGGADYRYAYPSNPVATRAEGPTISAGAITPESVVVNFSTSADGGAYNKEVQYSIDGGTTWVTGATVIGGSEASGTFTITNLVPGTAYSIQSRVNTTAGATAGNTINVNTPIKVALYGSVLGQTRLIKTLYCSVNGETKKVKRLYGSVNGRTKLIYEIY